MLKTLILRNLVLIEEETISFEPGLTIITGETGSGKTALIEAIRLILGERADVNKVRKGCDKAFVQGAFDLKPSPFIQSLFDETGLSLPDDENLLISREISSTGKGRAFVSGQMVPISFLQKLAPYLVDFIGQHAQILLKNLENQRHFLDLYAEIDLSEFQKFWEIEKDLAAQISILQDKKKTSDQRQTLLQSQLDELLGAHLQEGEEETLFEEYTLLANSEELLTTTNQILSNAEEANQKSTEILFSLEKILKYKPSLEEALKMAKETRLQLGELSLFIQSFRANIETDPHRLVFLEERLKTIDFLKKKYGENLLISQDKLQSELDSIETIDNTLDSLCVELSKAKERTRTACSTLSKMRQLKALELEKSLSKALQELNIIAAQVKVRVESTTRSKFGEDAVTFFLRANLGEELVSIKESSSGGELSRLLFSLKIALAEKNTPKTMVFDEIDANVGGETATIIGEKLKELGKIRQILCITHFPQVARLADHHLCVYKEKRGNRTICKVVPVSQKTREAELLRMLGGQKNLISLRNDPSQN